MLQILRDRDYVVTPWKNGGGITKDVLLLPEGSTQDNFDIRVSLAPILNEGPFSSYPGIDRQITLLSHAPLGLDFGDKVHALERLEPFGFDSVLQPISRLEDGAAQVINVMTRRGRWTSDVTTVFGSGDIMLEAPPGGMAILYAVEGDWRIEGMEVMVHASETLVCRNAVKLSAAVPQAEVLIALIFPSGSTG